MATDRTSTSATSGAGLAAYIAVWAICGVGALVAPALLFVVPKLAFSDAAVVVEEPVA